MDYKEFDYAKDSLEMRPYDHYLGLFKDADPEEVAERTGVKYNPETKEFFLHMMNKGYYISHPGFEIRKADEADEGYHVLLDFHKAKIFVLRFLVEARFSAWNGNFITFRDTPEGNMYFKAFQGRCIFRFQFGFGYKLNKFVEACEKVNGKKEKMGDVAYTIEFMDGLFMTFILWEGDDEFQPSGQILFSDNFGTVFSAEDLAVAGDISIGNLKAVC